MKPLTPKDFSTMHLRRIYENREPNPQEPRLGPDPTDSKLESYFEGMGAHHFESYITKLQEYQLESLQFRLDNAFSSVEQSISKKLPNLQNDILKARDQQCRERRLMSAVFALFAIVACVLLFSLPRLFRAEFDASVRRLDSTLNRATVDIVRILDSAELKTLSSNAPSVLKDLGDLNVKLNSVRTNTEVMADKYSNTALSAREILEACRGKGLISSNQIVKLSNGIFEMNSGNAMTNKVWVDITSIQSKLDETSNPLRALQAVSDIVGQLSASLKRFQSNVSDEISTLNSQVTLSSGPVLYLLVALIGMLITLSISNYLHSVKEKDAANLEAMQFIRLQLYSSLMSTLIASKVPNENAITLLRMFMDRRDSNAHLGSFMPLGKAIEQLIDALKKR